jgi:hypothetical protein
MSEERIGVSFREIALFLVVVFLIAGHLFAYIMGLREGERIQRHRLISYVVFPARYEQITVGGKTILVPKKEDVDKLIERLQKQQESVLDGNTR